MTDFPQKIWDGRSNSRQNLDCVKSPDQADWTALLDELQAMQGYILNLTDSMDTMPNLAREINNARVKIKTLGDSLSRLTPPADLQKDIDDLRQAVEEADIKNEHNRLKRSVQKLYVRTKALIQAYEEYKKKTEYRLEVLANSIRVNMTQLRADMEERTNKLEEQVKELQDLITNPELS
jgi:DNA repair exonuclease SbcCD ATPase subunit